MTLVMRFHYVSTINFFTPEECENCLTISTKKMTVMEGDVMLVTAAMMQCPHSGISLMVNGSDALTSSDFDCASPTNVLSNEVVYNCTAKTTGMMRVQCHTIFCDVDHHSEELLVEIKSKRIIYPITCPVVMCSWAVRKAPQDPHAYRFYS